MNRNTVPIRHLGKAPERGTRPQADGCVRSAGGVSGPRRVAQSRALRRARGQPEHGRRGRRGRVRLLAGHHGAAHGQPPGRSQAGQDHQRPRGGRGPQPRGRRGPGLAGGYLRLLRALSRLGPRPRALPPARGRHPERGRSRGPRARVPRSRRAAGLGPAARRRQARAHARLPGLPRADPRRGPYARGAPAPRAPRAGCGPRPRRRRAGPPLGPPRPAGLAPSSVITPRRPTATPPS